MPDKALKGRLALWILLLPALALSQQRDDFLRPFFGYYDSQSLSTAIGNATVAAGQVIPGRSSNPANLGLSRFKEFQLNFQHNKFQGPQTNSANTQLGGVYAVFPVAVYQGSLVFGGGAERIVDFTNAFQTQDRQVSEEGGIYATELGMSVEASKNLFIGAAFNYLKGSDELSTTEPDTNSLLNPKYHGYCFSLGFVNRTTANLQIGGSFQFATSVKVQDNLTTWHAASPEASVSETWNYELDRPMVFHLGFSLLYPIYSLFYEMEWSDWSGLKFSSDEYFAGDANEINREIKHEFRPTLTHHLGGAAHLPWLPLHLYAGYQYMPVPFTGVYASNLRQSLGFGASYLLSQQFSVHSSYSDYFWRYSGKWEDYQMLLFGVSLHF